MPLPVLPQWQPGQGFHVALCASLANTRFASNTRPASLGPLPLHIVLHLPRRRENDTPATPRKVRVSRKRQHMFRHLTAVVDSQPGRY